MEHMGMKWHLVILGIFILILVILGIQIIPEGMKILDEFEIAFDSK